VIYLDEIFERYNQVLVPSMAEGVAGRAAARSSRQSGAELATIMAATGRSGDCLGWGQQQVSVCVARLCFGCSRGFEEMLQVFHVDVAKVDLDVAMLQK
jgi:hypothetical protein